MNKRQEKKRRKIHQERLKLIQGNQIVRGRMNGKYLLFKELMKIILSKKYKPYKELKKRYEKLLYGVDVSRGKDYSVEALCYSDKGISRIIKYRIF